MTRRIRILQVGLGDWGRDWAWRVNPTVDEAEVVGYVDSDPPALALLAKRLPVSRGRCFGSLADGIQATQPGRHCAEEQPWPLLELKLKP